MATLCRQALHTVGTAAWIFVAALNCAPAAADTSAATERDVLFHRTLKHPQDVPLALTYADACAGMGDYEGAIGALERVLFYAPNDAHVKAALGLLYARLHSHQMAKQYFDDALASPDLDAGTRAKIGAFGSGADTALADNQTFAFIQAGTRYQTNAAFNPDNNIIRLSNLDFTFLHPRDRGADGNAFETIQAGYDHDLGNQRGDTLEFRVTGYATQQFRFTDLNVGLYAVSIGPRLALAPDTLPGWTVKPFVAGGQVFLAGSRYLASGGAGIVGRSAGSSRLHHRARRRGPASRLQQRIRFFEPQLG